MMFFALLLIALSVNAQEKTDCQTKLRNLQMLSHSKPILQKCIKKELPSDVCMQIYSKQTFNPIELCNEKEGDVVCSLCNEVSQAVIDAVESDMAYEKVMELMGALCTKFKREFPRHYCYFTLNEIYFGVIKYLESGDRAVQFCEWAKLC